MSDSSAGDISPQQLEAHERRARELQRTLDNIQAELEAEQLVIDGMRRLLRLRGALDQEPENDDQTEPRSEPAPPSGSEGGGLTAKEAALTALQRQPGDYRVPQLLGLIEDYGLHFEAKRPEAALRTALIRLEREGVVERRGHGLYGLARRHDGFQFDHEGTG